MLRSATMCTQYCRSITHYLSIHTYKHLHTHTNQVSTYVSAKNQWAGVVNWFQPGDWVDTLSALGTLIVLIRPERFVGR
jgi:hypothetical protein